MRQMVAHPPVAAAEEQSDRESTADMRQRLYRERLYREIERANALTDAESAAAEDRGGVTPKRHLSGYGDGKRYR